MAAARTVFGHDVVREAHVVRQLIGVTGQYASVDETLSANENLYLFSRLNGLSAKAARAKSAELLEEFGPHRCREASTEELLRWHASPPRPRGKPHLAAAADLPRRAYNRT